MDPKFEQVREGSIVDIPVTGNHFDNMLRNLGPANQFEYLHSVLNGDSTKLIKSQYELGERSLHQFDGVVDQVLRGRIAVSWM